MKLENFKLLFKSKKIVDSIYQQKKYTRSLITYG